MATFKVGQRVKVVRLRDDVGYIDNPGERARTLGCTGTVDTVLPFVGYAVLLDGPRNPRPDQDGCYGFFPEELAPLTDPKADEFIERMKKLAREPQPIFHLEPAADAPMRKLLS